MREPPVTAVFDRWAHPSYEIRVRGDSPPAYLWGSAGITKGIEFDRAPILHMRNSVFGQPITLSTQSSATATPSVVGTIQPGECVSIELKNISGIFASCVSGSSPLESEVACIIRD